MAWAFKTSDSNSQIYFLSAFVARQKTLPPLRHGSRTMPSVCLSPFALMIKMLCPMRKLWGLERAICRSSVFKSVCFSLLSISRGPVPTQTAVAQSQIDFGVVDQWRICDLIQNRQVLSVLKGSLCCGFGLLRIHFWPERMDAVRKGRNL